MTLQLYQHAQLAPSRAWVALAPEERRRRAVAAVASQDTATLLDLLEAHHVRTHGHVSPETLRKYRLGSTDLQLDEQGRKWCTSAPIPTGLRWSCNLPNLELKTQLRVSWEKGTVQDAAALGYRASRGMTPVPIWLK